MHRCKTEDAHVGQQGQQTRGEEIEAADGGLLIVPPELQDWTFLTAQV
jgi:hypothetical protein